MVRRFIRVSLSPCALCITVTFAPKSAPHIVETPKSDP
jgi:hypothetical protein